MRPQTVRWWGEGCHVRRAVVAYTAKSNLLIVFFGNTTFLNFRRLLTILSQLYFPVTKMPILAIDRSNSSFYKILLYLKKSN